MFWLIFGVRLESGPFYYWLSAHRSHTVGAHCFRRNRFGSRLVGNRRQHLSRLGRLDKFTALFLDLRDWERSLNSPLQLCFFVRNHVLGLEEGHIIVIIKGHDGLLQPLGCECLRDFFRDLFWSLLLLFLRNWFRLWLWYLHLVRNFLGD